MKTVINSLEEVAEPLRSEYESRDGKFHLKIEGDVPALVAANAKIVEFRNKNIDLLKEVDTLKPIISKFEGIDADAARDALAKVKALGSKGITDITDFNEKVRSTVDDMLKPLRDQLQAETQRTETERKRADEFLLASTISDRFTKIGGRAKASEQVVALARENFEVKDSKVVAKTGKFSTEKPGDPLTPEEWLQSTVIKDYDFLFEPSKGGGAAPATPGRTNIAVPKDGVKIIKNPTPQELGALAADAKAGKVRFEYDDKVTA